MDKRAAIEEARRTETCPRCHKQLGDDRIGSGRLADGVFCSLDCQAKFHIDYYHERIKHLPSSN